MSKRHTYRTQRWTYRVTQELEHVHQAARRDRETQFTALLHHVNVERLRQSFQGLRKQASAGIDGVTWQEYEKNLESNLQDLHGRIHRGSTRVWLRTNSRRILKKREMKPPMNGDGRR